MQCEWRASKYQFSGNKCKDPYYFYTHETKKEKENDNWCPFRQALISIYSFIKGPSLNYVKVLLAFSRPPPGANFGSARPEQNNKLI